MAEAKLEREPSFRRAVQNALRTSDREWGRAARDRYQVLIRQALQDLRDDPYRSGVKPVEGRPGVFGYHLRHSRNSVPAGMKVGRPRHVIFFRKREGSQLLQLLELLHHQMLPEIWLASPEDQM